MGANLKEVRDRIKSVKSTQQITRAMKMVSAAKLRRAQTAIQQMRPYANKMNEMLKNILSNMEAGDASSKFGVEREVNKVLMVCITSNRGLCGGFNSNIIKGVVNTINDKYTSQLAAGNVSVMCIGKKGMDFFGRRKQYNAIDTHVNLFADLSFDQIAPVANEIMDSFSSGEYDAVEISYGRFKNAAVQFAEVENYLPVETKKEVNAEAAKEVVAADNKKADYIFEPNKQELLEQLIPSILQNQLQKCCLDTKMLKIS